MKVFIEKEKARLQALFEPFNEGGSWVSLVEPGRDMPCVWALWMPLL